MIREALQSPPPPPPPPAQPPAGQPPMMPPSGAGAIAAAGNLASPGLRIVGGLIDFVLLAVVIGVVEGVTRGSHGASGFIGLIIALAYFGYFWSSRGQTVGMMVFGFRVRDQATGQYPSVGKAVLRGFIWWLEVGFTICIFGAIGWLWQLWDPRRQAVHDKIAGTIVTAN